MVPTMEVPRHGAWTVKQAQCSCWMGRMRWWVISFVLPTLCCVVYEDDDDDVYEDEDDDVCEDEDEDDDNGYDYVKCLRKGSTALECPVCLHLYCNPVVPMNCGCRCTFCEGCLENLIRISDGKCSSCQQDLPKKIGSWVPNQEIIDAIAKFQKQAGARGRVGVA
eukprot:768496-Hanusia_phi.AAC.4